MQRLAFGVACLAVLVLAAKPSAAQTWPQRAVKFIVTLGPGSGVDIGARLIGDRLSRRWGQPVVVENRPGGDGLVAISAFVGANDDHVLLAAPSGSFTAHPFIYKNLPYKPADIVPIARVSNTIVVMAVPASLEVKSVAELVAMARAQPGKLNWAGTTGSNEFLFAAFLKNAGLLMSKVPYRNLVEAANDLAIERIRIPRGPLSCPMCPRSPSLAIPTLLSMALSAFSARRPCRSEFAKASPRMFGRPLIRRSRNG